MLILILNFLLIMVQVVLNLLNTLFDAQIESPMIDTLMRMSKFYVFVYIYLILASPVARFILDLCQIYFIPYLDNIYGSNICSTKEVEHEIDDTITFILHNFINAILLLYRILKFIVSKCLTSVIVWIFVTFFKGIYHFLVSITTSEWFRVVYKLSSITVNWFCNNPLLALVYFLMYCLRNFWIGYAYNPDIVYDILLICLICVIIILCISPLVKLSDDSTPKLNETNVNIDHVLIIIIGFVFLALTHSLIAISLRYIIAYLTLGIVISGIIVFLSFALVVSTNTINVFINCSPALTFRISNKTTSSNSNVSYNGPNKSGLTTSSSPSVSYNGFNKPVLTRTRMYKGCVTAFSSGNNVLSAISTNFMPQTTMIREFSTTTPINSIINDILNSPRFTLRDYLDSANVLDKGGYTTNPHILAKRHVGKEPTLELVNLLMDYGKYPHLTPERLEFVKNSNFLFFNLPFSTSDRRKFIRLIGRGDSRRKLRTTGIFVFQDKENDQVLYVGSSTNLAARISDFLLPSKARIVKGPLGEFVRSDKLSQRKVGVLLLPKDYTDSLFRIKQYFILKYNPTLNIVKYAGLRGIVIIDRGKKGSTLSVDSRSKSSGKLVDSSNKSDSDLSSSDDTYNDFESRHVVTSETERGSLLGQVIPFGTIGEMIIASNSDEDNLYTLAKEFAKSGKVPTADIINKLQNRVGENCVTEAQVNIFKEAYENGRITVPSPLGEKGWGIIRALNNGKDSPGCYIFTNKETGAQGVGSSIKLGGRLQKHMSGNSRTHIANHINTYGRENFLVEVIRLPLSIPQTSSATLALEQYLMLRLNPSINHFFIAGSSITSDEVLRAKRESIGTTVYFYNKGALIFKASSINQAREILNVSVNTIRWLLRSPNLSDNFTATYSIISDAPVRLVDSTTLKSMYETLTAAKHRVYLYMNGALVASFKSIVEISNVTGFSTSQIQKSFSRKGGAYDSNILFSRTIIEDASITPLSTDAIREICDKAQRQINKSITVYVYENGVLIAEYPSINQAFKANPNISVKYVQFERTIRKQGKFIIGDLVFSNTKIR